MILSKVCFTGLLISASIDGVLANDSTMARVPSGRYESFVPEKKTPGAPLQAPVLFVKTFDMDRTPVTNGQFLSFVLQNPAWQRDKASGLFTEPGYLLHWEEGLKTGPGAPLTSPVVNVSWFAARAYCRSLDKRLLTTAEWEYVAGPEFFGQTKADRENFLQLILEWYARPSPLVLQSVGQPTRHRLGMQDLHGLIWEWTSDFSSNIASTELRDNSSPDAAEFCGAATLGGKDPTNYASYMRFAFRSSLKGGFSLANLGFRCARDVAP
ncbi:MAG TPA: formylglycine-generating enzyme family protein [Oligoflexus sp.]|uniref:formylglycine-generating enzyme family protein n=1 Tax=Oligoflexus sp. TaxID=1971216 RepID=UPI002D544DDC|nr:formylglycine-generating enzyme family protein [Oligoflexus sp.]HYX36711.1 formylglycine-generating enzyme family protein [Oligoflexus sp.]